DAPTGTDAVARPVEFAARWRSTRRAGQRSDVVAPQARDPMMEIRAKARRLKQKHDLTSIVIDYLQLMTSGKKVESRQQEVSEFSRQLKLLAEELEGPVVAMSWSACCC